MQKVLEYDRRLVLMSTMSKKPGTTSPEFMELLGPLQKGVEGVVEMRDNNRGSPLSNHLSAVAESVGVVAWVTMEHKPYKHVEESLGSAQYFGNRVLSEFKEK